MKLFLKDTFILAIIIFIGFTNSCRKNEQGPDAIWEKTYGGVEQDLGMEVQQTTDGGYVIVGYTESFGAKFQDIYIVKTDASGNTLWSRIYGGEQQEWGYSIDQTNDGGYIISGHTTSFGAGGSDFYLIKTDENGDTLWTRTYGDTDFDMGTSVQQTSDGGYIVTGITSSYGAGGNDVWLVKTDSNGDTVWTKTYGGADDESGYSVQQTNDGGYIIGGLTESFGAGHQDIYVIKTDGNGNVIWTKTYGGTNQEWGSVRQTTDGGYIVSGWTNSFCVYEGDMGDFYLIKTDENGDTLWTRTFGGKGRDYSTDVVETSDADYIVVGHTTSFGAGEDDIYLIKTDTDGNLLWSKTYGGADIEWSSSLQITSDNCYIITGHTYSFGAGSRDVYLIKTESDVE